MEEVRREGMKKKKKRTVRRTVARRKPAGKTQVAGSLAKDLEAIKKVRVKAVKEGRKLLASHARGDKRPFGFTLAQLGGYPQEVIGPANIWADLAGGERLILRMADDGKALSVALAEPGRLKVVANASMYIEVSKLRKGE